ncbi:hypothetical protein SY88_09880 [Clostridiales bacterium PH28_bin88]|nr:hypothetical protein SY88_09880 [Clostridiales bacterium PH28_bin88]
MAFIAAGAADDKKAMDIVILDLQGVSLITDYFLICTGRSATQVQSIAQHIEEKLEEQEVHMLRREGYREARWILLDYGHIVVHIFQEEDRAFYNLERLWGDAKVVDWRPTG